VADVTGQPLQLLALLGLGGDARMQRDKIAGSDFEQPKAGPKGEGQDARSSPATWLTGSSNGSSLAGRVCPKRLA